MAVIAKPQVAVLPALLGGGGGRRPASHSPRFPPASSPHFDPPLLCRSQEPQGPGIAGKVVQIHLGSPREQERAWSGVRVGEHRSEASHAVPDPGSCLSPGKVFTGCYLRQPQRTSTRTLSSTRWTQGHGTRTSTPTASGPIR